MSTYNDSVIHHMLPIKQRYQVNLPEYLAKCETNYWQLCRLFPDVAQLGICEHRQLIVGNNPDNESIVDFEVLEQSRYTTLLHIVQGCPLQNPAHCVKSTYSEVDEKDASAAKAKITAINPIARDFTEDYSVDVRLYHDAEIAEVIRYQQHRQFNPRYEYPNAKMHQVDEKSTINQFLGELIAHCLLNARVASVVIDGKDE